MHNCHGQVIHLSDPQTITEDSENQITSVGHSHKIEKASQSTAGIVKVVDHTESTDPLEALSANQGRVLAEALQEVIHYNKDETINQSLDAALGYLSTRLTASYSTLALAEANAYKHAEASLIYVVNDAELSNCGLYTIQGGQLVKAPWDALSGAINSEQFEVLQDIMTLPAGTTVEYQGNTYISLATLGKVIADGQTEISDIIQTLANANGLLSQYILTDSGKTQEQENKAYVTTVENYTGFDTLWAIDGRTVYVKNEGLAGEFVYEADSTAEHNGGTIIVDVQNRRWIRQFNGRADIRWFGAVVGTDSTTAIQKALDAKIPLSIKGKYYVNAQLTVTNYIDIEGVNNLSDALIWLSTAPSYGIKATFDNWYSEASISKLGILTQKQGVGTAIQFDATEALTRLLANTISSNYFQRFRKISQCMIRSESINSALYGWKNGIELNCPFAVEIKDNEIYGKASAGAANASDYIANSVGVHIPDQTLRTLANVEVSNNRIFNFHTACKVYNVEGFTFTNNDLQVDFDGLVILNTIMKVNQYRINLNHIGVTNDGISITNARQVLIHQNELSYRNVRTDVGAEVYMIKLDSVYSFNIVGNSIRGNKFNNDDVLINGILLQTTVGLDITRDGSITANQFQNLNNGVVSALAKHIKVMVAGNNYDGIRGLKLVNDRSPARNAQFQIGNGDFSTSLDNLNPALRVENTGAMSILALRPNGGAVASFGTNAPVGNISVTDTAVTFNTTSDQTLKNDQGLASKSEATELLNQIDIHNFKWKVNDQHDIGAFAQELYQVYPNAVTKGGWVLEDGSISDTEVEGAYYQAWSVDYSKLIPLLILSIQNLSN